MLQSKGIDPTAVEKRVEKKASVVKFTGEFITLLMDLSVAIYFVRDDVLYLSLIMIDASL